MGEKSWIFCCSMGNLFLIHNLDLDPEPMFLINIWIDMSPRRLARNLCSIFVVLSTSCSWLAISIRIRNQCSWYGSDTTSEDIDVSPRRLARMRLIFAKNNYIYRVSRCNNWTYINFARTMSIILLSLFNLQWKKKNIGS